MRKIDVGGISVAYVEFRKVHRHLEKSMQPFDRLIYTTPVDLPKFEIAEVPGKALPALLCSAHTHTRWGFATIYGATYVAQ